MAGTLHYGWAERGSEAALVQACGRREKLGAEVTGFDTAWDWEVVTCIDCIMAAGLCRCVSDQECLVHGPKRPELHDKCGRPHATDDCPFEWAVKYGGKR